ncbi:MAG TPA: MmgE/PrpD family protein [Terriglobales bacterium]|nr:MmgE/PrpD family protein [Terriglobales bacterium]
MPVLRAASSKVAIRSDAKDWFSVSAFPIAPRELYFLPEHSLDDPRLVSACQRPATTIIQRLSLGATLSAKETPASPGTITARMAQWAASLEYKHLSQDAVYHAKRFLLDSVGCALGGYRQHDVKIALGVLDEVAGPGPATVIGTGKRIDPVSAALANALMIRCMDYNDIYWKQDPSHPSDIFPGALAACERAKADGRELIVGFVLGHEFEMRLCEAAFPGIRERGWHHATLTAFVSPFVTGRGLRLSWQQIQHAVGISASCHCTLGAVTAGKLTMMKNTVDPMATQSGMFAALLAEKGYTGPEHVIDGKEGLVHCFGPEWKLNLLTDGLGESWRITQCGMKFFPTEALTHAPGSAVLSLVKKHDLHPDQVAKIQIRSLARAADILSDPSKYDPHTKETADHSLPYVIAAALVDRQVTPAQFEMWKIMDPTIRAQLGKVEVIADPEIEKLFPALQRVIVNLTTTDGRNFTEQLDYPKGDPRNPLTDQEIEEKFSSLADGVLSPPAQRKLKDAIWNLEKISSASKLMALMKADGGSKTAAAKVSLAAKTKPRSKPKLQGATRRRR